MRAGVFIFSPVTGPAAYTIGNDNARRMGESMRKPIIGILTWRKGNRFQEPVYFRRLIAAGRELGAEVFLFSHTDAFIRSRQIRGYVPSANGGWVSRLFPWPDAVIDRCRKGEPGYREFRRKNLFPYVNSTYTRKWNATQLFMREDNVKKWIPVTREYSPSHLRSMLESYPLLYIKPGNGTGGRSIVKLERTPRGYEVQGRDRASRKKSARFQSISALTQWLNRWVKEQQIRNGNFMIQQGLQLSLVPNRVCDVRLLIQKNEHGIWTVTGLGVRVGPPNSATSNLHGGGKAVPFDKFMTARFGAQRTQAILQECHELAHEVVKTIEKHFGSMMEFGLDIGVDVNGRVWLIEVNPKPGREIFRETGQIGLYKTAIRRPLQYALHVIQSERLRHNQTG